MDFFKSILSDDPDPPIPDSNQHSPNSNQDSEPNSPTNHPQIEPEPNPNPPNSWSFGGLIKTLTTRSETVLETYRRDLQEFKSELKKETDLFREAATRSIEVGASAAANIISKSLESQFETLETNNNNNNNNNNSSNTSFDSRRYSRFDAQLRAIQSDVNTYCVEPEDLEEYGVWKVGFVLEEKSEEIEDLIGENVEVGRIYESVVPDEVDREVFWCRYFYRVHKLKQQEYVRANLVKRAISVDDEEELSWDVDDDEDGDEGIDASRIENEEKGGKDSLKNVDLEKSNDEKKIVSSKSDEENENLGSKADVDDINLKNENLVSKSDEEKVNVESEKLVSKSEEENVDLKIDELSEKVGVKNDELVSKSDDEKAGVDEKVDNGKSGKDSDLSVVSTQPPLQQEEEDLGWDEIEDLGSGDEKKVSHGGNPNIGDLRKRLSVGEDDEDLSWDIEDDDEPVKHSN